MGNEALPFGGKEASNLRSCTGVMVVASARFIAPLVPAQTAGMFPDMALVETSPEQSVALTQVQAASLVVLEVDPADQRSMDRLVQLHRAAPRTPIIAAIPDASVTLVRALVREGVADVVALPFDLDELLETSLNALAAVHQGTAARDKLAPTIAMVRSVGGCGATSIATHMAVELANRDSSSGEAVIADLDLQFGSVADFLGAEGRGTIADLLNAGLRIDSELIRSVARWTDRNVAVLAAPDDIIPLETVDTDQLLGLIDNLRRSFGYVILDLPANWTNWTLSAALAADVIVLVVELSVASLRQARRRLDLFAAVGIPKQNIQIVVNRVEKKLFRTIDVGDVAETLRHPVLATVALDEPNVNAAQNQGRLANEINRKSRFGADIARLVEQMLEGPLRAGK